jgi:isopentenyl-diphosphate delta-isomerase
MTEISARKKQHLDIAAGESSQAGVEPGWFDVHLIPASFPLAGPDDLDLSVSVGGCELSAPLMIAGMTGGHPAALVINERLAIVAEEMGIAVGSGSQRVALRDPSVAPTFEILRRAAPNGVVVANIGVCQLVRQGRDEPLRRDDILGVVGMLDAQLLAVHLNVLEELIQPDGDRNVSGLLEAIGQVVEWSPVPVMVKETGSGMSLETARAVAGVGAALVDVGGAGGTSFARIEGLRAREQGDHGRSRLGETFGDWGIPTAQAILEVRGVRLPVIATGGVRSGLDAAKAIVLGATIVGLGRPALLAAQESLEALRRELTSFLDELRLAASLVGATSTTTLQGHRPVLTGAVLDWVNQRGLTW